MLRFAAAARASGPARALGAVLAVLLGVGAAGAASIGASYADASPVSVTITAPQLAGGVLTGALTLRRTACPWRSTPGACTATIDGKAYPVDASRRSDRPQARHR